MAYSFDKIDDYYRRNKTGGQGTALDRRGTTGAPPPTVAANNLAKSAETSSEQGNAGTYRQQKMQDTSAIGNRLLQPVQTQANNWSTEQTNKANDYMNEGNKQIAETYQPFEAGDVSKAEAGEAPASSKLSSQLGYKGTEKSFLPYQVTTPTLDTTSMLSSGIGGIQSGLQKAGGRYTPGMAALDSSLFSANRGAIGGMQNRVGNIQQGMRNTKQNLEQTDENLAGNALKIGTGVSQSVRDALTARAGALRDAQVQRGITGSKSQQDTSLGAQNKSALDEILAQLSGTGYNQEQLTGAGIALKPEDYYTTGKSTLNVGPTQGQINIGNILGEQPGQVATDYETYGIDKSKIGTDVQSAVEKYRKYLADKEIERLAKENPPPPPKEPVAPLQGEEITPIGQNRPNPTPTTDPFFIPGGTPPTPPPEIPAQVDADGNVVNSGFGWAPVDRGFVPPEPKKPVPAVVTPQQEEALAAELEELIKDTYPPTPPPKPTNKSGSKSIEGGGSRGGSSGGESGGVSGGGVFRGGKGLR